ncbi:aminodeoxychorismate synthase, component I, partial [Chloroflexota bacterium]
MSRYPLIEEINTTLSPLDAFDLFHNDKFSCFLDSGMDPERLGRYSFICIDPFIIMKSRGNKVTLISKDGQKIEYGNPFDIIERLLETYKLDCSQTAIPFTGGAVGYLSYDLCHFIEHLPST